MNAIIAAGQHERERALLGAALLDLWTAAMLLFAGVATGSLTVGAEGLRGGLMMLIDFVSLVVLRRIHRGALAAYEFGTGKLERFCALLVAAGLVAGTLWVAMSASRIAIDGRSAATPLGLAIAAIIGSVNLCANFVAWNGVRQSAAGVPSAIMQAQLRSRRTKLLASLAVQVSMTAAAWAKDPDVAAVADAAGAFVVCGVMASAAWKIAADALLDLLDRSASDLVEPAMRQAVQSLPAGFVVQGFRSRGTPHALSLEVTLGCAPLTGVAAAHGVGRRLAAEVVQSLPGMAPSVVIVLVPLAPALS
jgi:divalent metal cation (Fe/Co/Zn/Cd) transporter